MVILAKEIIVIGPPARGVLGMTSYYRVIKDQQHNSWKAVPTIISDRDSDPIGVRIPETQDVREERCNTN